MGDGINFLYIYILLDLDFWPQIFLLFFVDLPIIYMLAKSDEQSGNRERSEQSKSRGSRDAAR